MLTGDKIETATNIAISTGLKDKPQRFFFMRDLIDIRRVDEYLKEFRTMHNHVLMIDGKTLETILKDELIESIFFELALRAPSVCVCRCSPT
jgi:phospholipid-translocating ATPase